MLLHECTTVEGEEMRIQASGDSLEGSSVGRGDTDHNWLAGSTILI